MAKLTEVWGNELPYRDSPTASDSLISSFTHTHTHTHIPEITILEGQGFLITNGHLSLIPSVTEGMQECKGRLLRPHPRVSLT